MLRLQPADGVWLNGGTEGNPYPLIGSAALFSLTKTGEVLRDARCRKAVAQYTHIADAGRIDQ